MSQSKSIEFDHKFVPMDPKDKQRVVIEYLRARKEAGFSFVNNRDIRRDTPFSRSQQIGSILRELDDQGYLEKWTNGSPVTYRIASQNEDKEDIGETDE